MTDEHRSLPTRICLVARSNESGERQRYLAVADDQGIVKLFKDVTDVSKTFDWTEALAQDVLEETENCVTEMLSGRLLGLHGDDLVIGDSCGQVIVVSGEGKAIARKQMSGDITTLYSALDTAGNSYLLIGDALGVLCCFQPLEEKWQINIHEKIAESRSTATSAANANSAISAVTAINFMGQQCLAVATMNNSQILAFGWNGLYLGSIPLPDVAATSITTLCTIRRRLKSSNPPQSVLIAGCTDGFLYMFSSLSPSSSSSSTSKDQFSLWKFKVGYSIRKLFSVDLEIPLVLSGDNADSSSRATTTILPVLVNTFGGEDTDAVGLEALAGAETSDWVQSCCLLGYSKPIPRSREAGGTSNQASDDDCGFTIDCYFACSLMNGDVARIKITIDYGSFIVS